jgi:hypothetical protein
MSEPLDDNDRSPHDDQLLTALADEMQDKVYAAIEEFADRCTEPDVDIDPDLINPHIIAAAVAIMERVSSSPRNALEQFRDALQQSYGALALGNWRRRRP